MVKPWSYNGETLLSNMPGHTKAPCFHSSFTTCLDTQQVTFRPARRVHSAILAGITKRVGVTSKTYQRYMYVYACVFVCVCVCVCVCLLVCVCVCVCNHHQSGRHTRFSPGNRGGHTQPWSSTVLSGCSSMVRTIRITCSTVLGAIRGTPHLAVWNQGKCLCKFIPPNWGAPRYLCMHLINY